MSTKATEEYNEKLKADYNEKLWDVIKKYPFFPYIQFNYMQRLLEGGEVLEDGKSNFKRHAVNNLQEHKKNLKEVNWQIFNDLRGRYSSLLFFFGENTARAIKKRLDTEFKKEGV